MTRVTIVPQWNSRWIPRWFGGEHKCDSRVRLTQKGQSTVWYQIILTPYWFWKQLMPEQSVQHYLVSFPISTKKTYMSFFAGFERKDALPLFQDHSSLFPTRKNIIFCTFWRREIGCYFNISPFFFCINDEDNWSINHHCDLFTIQLFCLLWVFGIDNVHSWALLLFTWLQGIGKTSQGAGSLPLSHHHTCILPWPCPLSWIIKFPSINIFTENSKNLERHLCL